MKKLIVIMTLVVSAGAFAENHTGMNQGQMNGRKAGMSERMSNSEMRERMVAMHGKEETNKMIERMENGKMKGKMSKMHGEGMSHMKRGESGSKMMDKERVSRGRVTPESNIERYSDWHTELTNMDRGHEAR